MTHNTREFFGFRDRSTGALVRLSEYEVENRTVYRLTDRPENPLYEAGSAEDLADVLFENTPWYNSDAKQPCWGEFKKEDLVPVKVRIVTETEEVKLPEPVHVTTLELRSIHEKLARMYAGAPIEYVPGKRKDLVFWLAELPEGLALEAARERLPGTVVHAKMRFTGRHVYAVAPVPEEYVPLTEGKRTCALLIAGGI